MDKKIIILLMSVTILLISSSADAATCWCSSCGGCTSDISTSSCDSVVLTGNIVYTGDSSCIRIQRGGTPSNPKILSCQSYRIYDSNQDPSTGTGIEITHPSSTLDSIRITGCEISGFKYGINWTVQQQSDGLANNVRISNNNIHDCGDACISIDNGDDNRIFSNTIENGNGDGIRILGDSRNNEIFSNTIRNFTNGAGIYGSWSDSGGRPEDNDIRSNFITENKYSVFFNRKPDTFGWLPRNWNIWNNYMLNENDFGTNAIAGELEASYWNVELYAQPVDQGLNIIGEYSGGVSWIGGNYWSNLIGNGFSDTCTDSSSPIGVCDSAHALAENNIDNYPLHAAYSCTGTIPDGANICPRDNIGLSQDTSRLLVASCTDTRKCQYTCKPGYIRQGSVCIPLCTSHSYSACYDSDSYWYDSCDNMEEKKEECGDDTCSDSGSSWTVKEYVDDDEACSDGECGTDATHWDYCDVNVVHDRQCSGNDLGTDITYDCDSDDGWYGGGNTAGCGDDSTSYYSDSSCSDGACTSSDTDSKDCDDSDVCGNVCDGTVIKSYQDYYVVANTDQCTSEWGSDVEDCATKSSADSDGGNVPGTAGTCTDYTDCSGGACSSTPYADVCDSETQLTEYYASGASCLSQTYTCSDFEVAATGDNSDDPATTGTCTAGTGAGCSSGAFSTTSGSSETEGCIDPDDCPGGADCVFREYYADDSGDSCSGYDTCTEKTYDPDTNSNTCDACVGSDRFDIGGIAGCCGDDASENKRTCQDSGLGACTESTDDEACCTDSSACVYNNVCYSHDGAAGGWVCNQGTWEGLSVTVAVTATPGSVTTTWQSAGASAGISCTPHPSTQCDTNSYRLETHASDPGSCSTTYADYILASPQAITSHVWVCGAAKDNHGTEGFSAPVRFFVDQINPTASIGSLPAWTTQNSVIVTWSGSDGESGLDYFELQYRITMVDGTETQGWTAWGSNPSEEGSLPFSGMANNRTYHFRARATDNVGNTGDWSAAESISVDLVDPTCAVWNLPLYATSPSFTVSWEGSDGESGIDYYNVQVRAESGACGSTNWEYLNDPDGYHTTETSDNVIGTDNCRYFFRCNSTDIAGNEGEWSGEKSTTVDATEPTSSVEDLERWINITSFTVSWSGFDETSGIDCYGINWSDGSGWNSWFACTQEVSATFGPDSPATVSHGVTYSFVSSARDLAGWAEDWPSQEDTLTTIDTVKPEYDVRAEDMDGNEVIGFVYPGAVEEIILKSTATDSVSGVEHNYIEYLVIDESGQSYGSTDCGPADPYGGVSECELTVDFAGGIMVEFWVKVIDRAGNENISDTFHIGTHPLANFGKHSLHMILGESGTLKIYVRNIQDQSDDVTVNLDSTLPIPPYFIGLGEFVLHDNTWVGDDINLTNNNRTIVVKDLNPGELRRFDVLLWSSNPEIDIYQVFLNAYSRLNEDLIDSDQALVRIGYPASFPGLNGWAVLVLIVLSVSAYAILGRDLE